MKTTGTVGAPASSIPPGDTLVGFRQTNTGELVMSEVHARYYEGAYRGGRFGGAMQAVIATATIAGVSASITGVSVLANPPGSSVNLVLEKFGVGFVVAPAAPLVYGIATGFSQSPLAGTLTSLAPKSKKLGSNINPVGQLYASAAITLPAVPTVDTVLGCLDTGAVTTQTVGAIGSFDLEGSILLPPGGFACFYTSAVLAASAHIASWQWEETPV